MRIKHWQGYGNVKATKIKDLTCKLYIRVEGNHEYGLRVNSLYDAYNWLVKRFDKSVPPYGQWRMNAINKMYDSPIMDFYTWKYGTESGIWRVESGYKDGIENCDYYFYY